MTACPQASQKDVGKVSLVESAPCAATSNQSLVYPMITHRLATIALRKYDEQPDSKSAASRMLLLNAARLAAQHLGEAEARSIVEQGLSGPKDHPA